jgi:hypothetical protein
MGKNEKKHWNFMGLIDCRKTGEFLGFKMMLWKRRAFTRKNHGVFRGESWRNGDFLVEGLRIGQAKSDTKPMTQPTCGSVFLRSARTWKKCNLKFEPRIDDGRKQSEMICAIFLVHVYTVYRGQKSIL